jgi:hypothetical protein
MISKGLFLLNPALEGINRKTIILRNPNQCPYFSKILTVSFWLTKLSSARRMSNVTSLGAETGLTVFDSRAEMRADDRSCAEMGVVIWEIMLLSKHRFTKEASPVIKRAAY